jgi:hypothetical protein
MKSVGEVTITGLKVQGVVAPLTIRPLSATNLNYVMPGSFEPDYPPFADGDALKLTSGGGDAGGDYSPFEINSQGISDIQLLGADPLPINSGQAATITWTPGKPNVARIQVELAFGIHGSSQSKITCDVADTGSLQVDKALIDELISFGLAGFPRLTVTRYRADSASISPGQVQLNVSSMVQRMLIINGQISCNADTPCPNGRTCQSNLTCAN